MKVIKRFSSRMDANIAKGFLVEQNIPAVVSADDVAGFEPHLEARGGVFLLVPEADLERAKKIMEQVSSADPLEEGEMP